MLLHLDSNVIKDLKKAAVDRESSASAIANEAIDTWLRDCLRMAVWFALRPHESNPEFRSWRISWVFAASLGQRMPRRRLRRSFSNGLLERTSFAIPD
jgi:hypothetical protein